MMKASDVTMMEADYPASFRMADVAAVTAQNRHFAILAGQLGCAFVGALLLGIGNSLASGSGADHLRQAAAVALLLSVVMLLTARVLRLDTVWWDARAVAESIKSSLWRYMMGAPPFATASGAVPSEETFLRQVQDARGARPGIAAALERQRREGTEEITGQMRTMRDATRAERVALYLELRLNNQRRWYSQKAKAHDRAREAYFVTTLFLQVVALLAAFFDWRTNGLSLVSLIIALSASLTAWAQAKRHEESAQAYALARQELDIMGSRLQSAADDTTFGAAVAETEEMISREHTMWMARRNR